MKTKAGLKRSNAAIKGCPRCKKLVPTATRYCRCGYDFKKPITGSESRSPVTPAPVAESRRKSERRQRITVKPDFYSPSDYENPFKKQRRRTTSDTSDDSAKKRRSRNRQEQHSISRKPSISTVTKPVISSATITTPSRIKTNAKLEPIKPAILAVAPESKDSNGNGKNDRDQEEERQFRLPPEKYLQYAIVLAEINRKINTQVFRPM